MDIDFVGQMIESMEDGVSRLEEAISKKDNVMANKLRIFILDIHDKISEALENV